jgi:hypothetical protein
MDVMSKSRAKIRFRVSGSTFAPLRLCLIFSLLLANLFIAIEIVSAQEPTPAEKPAAAPADPPTPATEKPAESSEARPIAKPDTPADPSANDQLSVDQARLADRYKRLEEVVGRLAELSASTDPRRAKLLRDAIAQSREQDINVRFESIVKLLQDERLSAAATNQTDLEKQLDSLLTLLLKADRDRELTSQRDRVQKYIKEVSRLIREQKGVRARTEGDDDLKSLGADQQRIASDTGKLGGNISKTDGDKASGGEKKSGDQNKDDKKSEPSEKSGDKSGDEKDDKKAGDDKSSKPNDKQKPGDSKSGKPSDADKPSENYKPGESNDSPPSDGQPGKPNKSKPSQSPPTPGQPGSPSPSDENSEVQQQQQDPADRATDRLKKAQQHMEQALKKLEEAQRKGASENQQKAIKELEQAKAELERVLRQLREEELERTLTQLAARFRKILEMQTAVYDGTVRLDQVPQAERTHDHEIEAARLSRDESQIVHEVDKALSLLHEEGSSVAFPEAIDQMRDDMRQVAERLAAIKPDKLTQSIEQDIIAALEETISALDKSIKDLEKKRTPPGQQPSAGQPGDMALVDKIAELKMIRSLQMRINTRTRRYAEMIDGDQAETPDLLKSLQDLADRQQRVYRATADLEQKRND